MKKLIAMKLNTLAGTEYYSPRQLLKYGKRAYEACCDWEEGKYKDAFFNSYLNILLEKNNLSWVSA